MATIFDLHVHTSRGSSDSNLSPDELVNEAVRLGLHGVCLTEHSGPWDRHAFRSFAEGKPVVLVRAMEVETDCGHVLVYGVDGYRSGMASLSSLRATVRNEGGYAVIAHPFRYLLGLDQAYLPLLYRNGRPVPQTPEEAADHPALSLVDAVEASNSGTRDDENAFAYAVAAHLGMPMTGGSDAHSLHGLGTCATEFEDDIRSESEFLKALRSGRFRPLARDPASGRLAPAVKRPVPPVKPRKRASLA